MYAEHWPHQPEDVNQPELKLVDDDLIIEHARRDPAAFAPIYDRYCASVYRMCLRASGDPDLADDLTAQTFLQALEKLYQYQPRTGSSFRSWLFVIARNTVHDHWRRNNRLRPMADDDPPPMDSSPGPEEIALHRLELADVRSALESLNDRHRSIVEFRLSGLTTVEIAQVLGISISALKSAQTRAYANIRVHLNNTGVAK